MRKPLTNFCTGDLQVPKTTESGYFQAVFVIGVQLKWHIFGQCQSFQGLVDIPRMCLFCESNPNYVICELVYSC